MQGTQTLTDISIAQLRQHMGTHIKKVEKGNRLMLKRHSKPVAVLIPLADYEALQKTDESKKLDQMYDALEELTQEAVSIEGAEDASNTIDEYLYGENFNQDRTENHG